MFDKLLRFSLILAPVFLFDILVGFCSTVRMGTVLEGLLMFWLFGFIAEVRRGDKSDDLFERVLGILPEEKVYKGRYATKEALKVAYDQSRSEFSGW